MKINKDFLAGFFMTLFLPVLGLIFTLSKIKKINHRSMVFNIFIFVFLFTLNLRPYQDLYRRYITTYLTYTDTTTFYQAIYGHVDVTFYIMSLLTKKLSIPFPFLVSLLSALSVMVFLKSILSGVRDDSRDSTIRWVVIIGLFLYPTIQFALGIRWGLGISLMIYGYFSLINKGKILLGWSVIFLAMFTHFSTIIIIPVLIASKFFKLNRLSFFVCSILALGFSALILPFVLSKLGGIGGYATAGYGAESDINNVGNLNSIIATTVGFLYTFYFLWLLLLDWKRKHDSNYVVVRNVTLFLFVFTCLSLISLVAFRRYTNALFYLFVVCTYLHLCLQTNRIRKTIIYASLICFLFNGIYLQRRPLILGETWRGLYIPATVYINLDTPTYNRYLKDIDAGGDWIGNKINQ